MNQFNAKEITQELINWIRDWFEQNGKNCNAVLGISGGKDSTIAAALCVKALGADRVIGLILPEGRQPDIEDSFKICNILNIQHFCIDISAGVEATYNALRNCNIPITYQTKLNVPPRERTKMIRAVCQSMNGRMVNTCNLSENYLGYFTIGGDGDGDFSPLGNLTATEVVAIGRELGLPAYLVNKTPADGLCDKTDEDRFGFTYEVLDKYIRTGICKNKMTKAAIDKRHQDNVFKLKDMDTFEITI